MSRLNLWFTPREFIAAVAVVSFCCALIMPWWQERQQLYARAAARQALLDAIGEGNGASGGAFDSGERAKWPTLQQITEERAIMEARLRRRG